MSATSPQRVPRLLAARYHLVERLGPQRASSVWLGWDTLLGRPVAVKPVAPRPGEGAAAAGERARAEARLTERLQWANVVPVYDVVEGAVEGAVEDAVEDAGDRVWLVMPFVPSRSLHRVLADGDPLDAAAVARLGADVARALAAAHRLGVAHGAVGLHSVLIAEDGAARLTAFGEAVVDEPGPAFQVTAGARDILDLGTLLMQALAGGRSRERRCRSLVTVIRRLRHDDPARRPTAAQALDELAALAVGPTSPGTRRRRWRRPPIAPLPLAAALVGGVLGTGAIAAVMTADGAPGGIASAAGSGAVSAVAALPVPASSSSAADLGAGTAAPAPLLGSPRLGQPHGGGRGDTAAAERAAALPQQAVVAALNRWYRHAAWGDGVFSVEVTDVAARGVHRATATVVDFLVDGRIQRRPIGVALARRGDRVVVVRTWPRHPVSG